MLKQDRVRQAVWHERQLGCDVMEISGTEVWWMVWVIPLFVIEAYGQVMEEPKKDQDRAASLADAKGTRRRGRRW